MTITNMEHLKKIKGYLEELGCKVLSEDPKEELFVVSDEENGIKNLIVDCEDPVLVLTQHILDIKNDGSSVLKRLLQMNNSLIHGAFVLDESGRKVYFRDTLELEHLDINELEGSIKALGLALAEHGRELIQFAKR